MSQKTDDIDVPQVVVNSVSGVVIGLFILWACLSLDSIANALDRAYPKEVQRP